MPFRRTKKGNYYIEPSIPGVGRFPRLSTGQKDKKVASDMEAALRMLACTGYADLVTRVRDGLLSLAELYNAFLLPDQARIAALAELHDAAGSRPMRDVVKRMKASSTDERITTGLDQLLKYAVLAERQIATDKSRRLLVNPKPKSGADEDYADAIGDLRISWLKDRKHLETMYELAMADGRKANTVRRGLHRAVAEILTDLLGRGATSVIMKDVNVPGEVDTRTNMLSLDEIDKALRLADDEFRPVVALAITTGIDRAPLLRSLVRHYDAATGLFEVYDTKTYARPRTLLLRDTPVAENAEAWLGQLTDRKQPHEQLTNLTEDMIRDRWEKLRDAIGRPDLRWKDLRGIFATYFRRAGGDISVLQAFMGHSELATTDRYVRKLPVGTKDSKAWKVMKQQARTVARWKDYNEPRNGS